MGARRWTTEAAGLACTIEFDDDEWVVTIAEASVARASTLDTAIVRACGGLVGPAEARELAASVTAMSPGAVTRAGSSSGRAPRS